MKDTGYSGLNGLEARLDRVIESLGDHSTVVQGLHERLSGFKHVDSLPLIAEGVKQLNKTLLWTHICMLGVLTLITVLTMLKDSHKDLSITPTSFQFGERRNSER